MVKDNLRFKRMYFKFGDKTTGVLCDQIGKLEDYYSKKDFPGTLRRNSHYEKEHKKNLVFLTNNTVQKAIEAALL